MTPHVSNRAFETLLRMRRVAPPKRTPSIRMNIHHEIQRICTRLGVPIHEVQSKTKTNHLVMARFIIAHELRGQGYTQQLIADMMNKDNHATIAYYLKRYTDLKATKDRLFMEMLVKL